MVVLFLTVPAPDTLAQSQYSNPEDSSTKLEGIWFRRVSKGIPRCVRAFLGLTVCSVYGWGVCVKSMVTQLQLVYSYDILYASFFYFFISDFVEGEWEEGLWVS